MNSQNLNFKKSSAVLELDRRGVTQYASAACAKMFGMSAEELKGQSIFTFLFDPDVEADVHGGAAFWLNDGGWRLFQGVDVKGQSFLLNVAKESAEKNGRLRLRLRYASKEGEEVDHLQRLQSAVERSPDSVCITDDKGMIEYVNRAFEKLTGFSYNDAVGKTPALLSAASHSSEFFNLLWANISTGQEFCGIFVKRKKNGSLYHEEMLIRPFIDLFGRIAHFVVTGRDVTERIQAGLIQSKPARFNGRRPLRRMYLPGQFSRKSHR